MASDRRESIAAELPRLRRYARALLHSPAEADDLVHDCLERALSRIGQWREGESPRKWLFTILHNIYVDRVRAGVRNRARLASGLAEGPEDSYAPSYDVTMPEIERALQQIPEDQRRVVLLVGLEGLSYAETAGVLDVPVGTVMSRLARGRERLRVLMDRDGARPNLRRVK